MKTHLHSIALIATLGAASLGAQTAAYPAAPVAPAAPAAAPAKPTSFTEALTMGKVSVNARLRYEHIDQPTTRADALTVRTRLGYKTASYLGLQAFIEGENTTELVDQFRPGPNEPTNTTKSVVSDPEVTDVSQAWVGYTHDKTGLTTGRQKVILDNSRWVGDVGFRQSGQSFDSVFVKDNTVKDLSLTYGYVWNVKRWFADTATNPDFQSNSHIINAAYKVSDYGTLTGYGYLLDFEHGAPATALQSTNVTDNSSATYGASFVGAAPVTDTLKATYRAEYATQSDYGSNRNTYTADYYIAELGAALKSGYALKFGYEVLGQDGSTPDANKVIRTPIATQHAHNGWADVFLRTPDGGLVDSYVSVAVPLPGAVTLTTIYHRYQADVGGADFGDEIDVVAGYKVNKNLSLTAKTAFYNGAGDSKVAAASAAVKSDKTVYWLQADYAF